MFKKQVLVFCTVLILILLLTTVPAFADVSYSDTLSEEQANIPERLDMDWDSRHNYGDIEDLFSALADEYPDLTELYSIGTSWQERNLWCLEITNEDISNKNKTGIGVFANIHGGEQESAESAIYTAWWLLINSNDEAIQNILDNYIVYVVPLINPDGFCQSFVYNNRQNLRPTDNNGNNIPFSDPYTDINNDGWISRIYKGTASDHGTLIGWESPDWDGNGVLGDDNRSSNIDLNRTFDYQWNRYDIETYLDNEDLNTPVIGANSWARAGSGSASEPEVRAVQNFLCVKPMDALVTLHTGEQSVLWPWCYRPYDKNNPEDEDIPFMAEVGTAMAQAFSETSGRQYYAMSSYNDYPTSAEMIDYAWGRLHIHAYTIEVYEGGLPSDDWSWTWGNVLPETKWDSYTVSQFKEMIDANTGEGDKVISDLNLEEDDVIWFATNSTAQMSGVAPEDQTALVKGCRDAILAMIDSEGSGLDTVATPTASPTAGQVSRNIKVTLDTTTENANIYYTIDGSTPTSQSTLYTEPINISSDLTIKAIAERDGMNNSDVLTARYTIRSSGGGSGGSNDSNDEDTEENADDGTTVVPTTPTVEQPTTPGTATNPVLRINGKIIQQTDTNIMIVNSRCLVPVRLIMETLGYSVDYQVINDVGTITVKYQDKEVVFHLNSKQALVNGAIVDMDVAPVIENGRTYVPLRFLAESFGCYVNWDGTNYIVDVNSNS